MAYFTHFLGFRQWLSERHGWLRSELDYATSKGEIADLLGDPGTYKTIRQPLQTLDME
jgi:hypothetical protein